MKNLNVLTKEACIDLNVDETLWGHRGWIEKQSGMVRIIINKPGVCKGG